MRKKRRQKTFKSQYQKSTHVKIPNKEIWKSVFGYEPSYNLKVSSYGRVILLPEIITDENGREYVLIAGRQIPVDRLVCDAFIPNRTQSEQPWHKDGDITNNLASNLTWVDYTSDPDSPGRMFSTLSMLQYILHPSLLADRDKEFNKFYTYLEYLWKTGRMPEEQEQLIMDGYEQHRKRVTEDYMQREQLKKDVADILDSQYRSIMTEISQSKPVRRKKKNTDPAAQSTDHTETEPNTGNLPYELPPDDIMASALTNLYERITTSAVKNPSRFHSRCWNNLAPIPFLITPAMARIVNIGNYPAELKPYSMAAGRIEIKAKDSKTKYQMTGLNLASMLEQSLTAPYHLNMVPQCPKIYREKKATPTQHLQSLIYTLKKTGKFPDWAKDSLVETLLKLIQEEKTQRDPTYTGATYKFGVSIKSDTRKVYDEKKLSTLEAELTDGLEQMIKEAADFREETGYDPTANSKWNRKKREYAERRAAKAEAESEEYDNDIEDEEYAFPTEDDISGYENETVDIDVNNKEASQPADYYDDYGFIAGSSHNKQQDIWEDGYAEPVITKVTRLQNDIMEESAEEAEMAFEAENENNNKMQSYSVSNSESDSYGNTEVTSGIDTESISEMNTVERQELKPGTEEHRMQHPEKYSPEGVYIGNNRNPESYYNKDVHPGRETIISDDVIRMFRLSPMINSEAEFDEKGRPVRDKHYRKIIYNDSEIPLGASRYRITGMGFHSPGDSQKAVDGFIKQMDIIKNGYDPDNISPLYDPSKDITLGMINSNAGLEESSYYNQLGQKVYHNVRYGERYDPERHTLYIPEIEAFPNPFSVEARKRNYLDDYVKYLKKHYPEIENPDILMRYYKTALAVKRIQKDVLPNCPKNELFKRGGKEIPVRCWLPNGECMVFDSMKQASEATGVSVEMIKKCCTGQKEEAYGLRWEYVDIADMDLMINKYLHDVIKICDECDMDVDWNEYIDSGIIQRMEDTIKFREKPKYGRFDNIRDVIYPEHREPGYFKSEWMKRRAEKWDKLKAVKNEEISSEMETYDPGTYDEEMYGKFDPDGLPGNDTVSHFMDKRVRELDGETVPYSDGLWEKIDETMYGKELDEKAEKLEKEKKSVEFIKEKLKERNRQLIEKQNNFKSEMFFKDVEIERIQSQAEKEIENKDRQMKKVADIASGKLMGFLDGFLTDEDSGSVGESKFSDKTEKETEDEKLERLLNEEHNQEH